MAMTASNPGFETPPAVGGCVLDLIGRTPLVDLSWLVERPGVSLYAKAELRNPGGSVKDRPALNMILDGGALRRARPAAVTILDATSGNTGIAYAMIGAARGYRVKLCLPANASPERKRILAGLRRRSGLTDPLARVPTAPSARPRRLARPTPTAISTPTSTTTRPTGGPTTRHRPGDLAADRRPSPTSSPAWAPAGTFMGVGRRLRQEPHGCCVRPAGSSASTAWRV